MNWPLIVSGLCLVGFSFIVVDLHRRDRPKEPTPLWVLALLLFGLVVVNLGFLGDRL